MDPPSKKQHRPRKAGVSAGKKTEKKQRLHEMTHKQQKKAIMQNPKAYVATSSVAARQHYQYTQTRVQEKLHVPLVDRTVDEPPPLVVVVVGPPGSGKTTLVQGLVKTYTHIKVNQINGPITMITGRQHRMTIIECPNDVGAMMDCAKIADVVVLMIDGSFGYEMQTFEFVTMLQAHGFPKVVACVTHLDGIKKAKLLRKRKKQLKRRFWRETYDGAKMFYMSNLIHKSYPKIEVQVLARHLMVLKTRPIVWRGEHSYLVVDRMEDMTPPQQIAEDPEVEREVAMFGYVRGTNMKPQTKVCVPGLGDFRVEDVEVLVDPCPLGDESKRLKTRTNSIYAPMSDVGGMRYDKDAVYVTVSEHQQGREDEGVVKELMGSSGGITTQIKGGNLVIVEGRVRRKVMFDDEEKEEKEESEESKEEMDVEEGEPTTVKMEEKGEVVFEEGTLEGERERKAWGTLRLEGRRDLMEEIYGEEKRKKEKKEKDDLFEEVGEGDEEMDLEDTSKMRWDEEELKTYLSEEPLEEVVKRFVPKTSRVVDDMIVDLHEEEEMDDDALDAMVSVENGEVKLKEKRGRRREKVKQEKGKQMEEDGEEEVQGEEGDGEKEKEEMEKDKKRRNDFWDDGESYMKQMQREFQERNRKNREAFKGLDVKTRVAVEGASAGMYVRVVLKHIPAGFVARFDPKRVVIVGGVLRSEETMTVMQAQVLKHRWYGKLVKTREPIVLSVGWRRFQTIATFSMETPKGQQRMLKYTPRGVFCTMTFFGPACATNSGVVGFETIDEVPFFRPAVTGNVTNIEKVGDVVKKLKLVGSPVEVKRNTAFIKGMFNTKVEAAKFLGAKIQTVSGIRGQIKKTTRQDGVFRATFEAKIAPSDIVFMKGWVPVKFLKFYNPMTDLTGTEWERMRLRRELKEDHALPTPQTKRTSHYATERKPKVNLTREQKAEMKEREALALRQEVEATLRVTKRTLRSLPFAEQLRLLNEGVKVQSID